MSDVLGRLGGVLLDAGLAAFAISGFVVLAMLQCRQPARRIGWARAGLVSSLAVIPLTVLNPFPRVSLTQRFRPVVSEPVESARSVRLAPAWLVDLDSSWISTFGRAVVVADLGGVFLGLAGLGLGIWGSNRLVGLGLTPSDRSIALYRSLPTTPGRPKPRLLVSDRLTRPVLVGVVRSTILIPPALGQGTDLGELRLGLLHELAHDETRDHRANLVSRLARSTWFFLPTIWWIDDQMRLDQEFLADRQAADRLGTSGGYASSLIDLAVPGAETTSEIQVGSPDPAGSRRVSALFPRVLMLLKCPFVVEARPPIWWRSLVVLLLVIATLATSSLTVRGVQERSNPGRPTEESRSGSFRLPFLILRQSTEDQPPFDLRFRLPENFRLTLGVLADSSELPSLEILGHRLGPLAESEEETSTSQVWHQVEVRRANGSEVLTVDGQSVARLSRPSKLNNWLSIRSLSSRSTRIRDLDLSW